MAMVQVQDTPFPEEVWLIILNNLEDSRDGYNVLLAYPQLDQGFHKKKKVWLFDQVIPHIFPYISQNDVLTCRQTCKKWTTGVDNFLENHPSKRAKPSSSSSEDKPHPGQLWLRKASPRHFHHSFSPSRHSFFTSGVTFMKDLTCQKFLQQMDGHSNSPEERNPFVGRSLTLIYPVCRAVLPGIWPLILEPEGRMDDMYFSSVLWPNFQNVLQKFGKHVWFAEFQLHPHVHEHPRFEPKLLCFFESLKSLPNLRSIKLTVAEGVEHRIEDLEQFFRQSNPESLRSIKLESFPPLRCLEVMELTMVGAENTFIIGLMMTVYSRLVRKLVINVEYWKRDYSGYFHNLSELTVNGDENRINSSKRKVLEMLNSVDAPKLTSLEVEVKKTENLCWGKELLPVLNRFPQLEHFQIMCQLEYEEMEGESGDEGRIQVLSLKSLIIRDGDFGEMKKVLKCFPNLEYLQIWRDSEPEMVENGNSGFTRRKVYESDELWQLLRKLECITLVISNDDEGEDSGGAHKRRYFTRSGFDYWRNKLAQFSSDNNKVSSKS